MTDELIKELQSEVGGGCWVAYYSDRSSIVAFDTELEVLRYAVGNCMNVQFVPWGHDLFTGDER